VGDPVHIENRRGVTMHGGVIIGSGATTIRPGSIRYALANCGWMPS